MQNLCEWAVVILLQSVKDIVLQCEYLQDLLSQLILTCTVDRQAQVFQMIVAPRLRFQLTSDGSHIAATHSLFLISSPLAGDFILKPTAEQYGIPREHRFLPWSIYKQLYIIDPEKFRGAAVWSVNFSRYQEWLERSPHWEFWSSFRAVLDAQTAAWLQGCELSTMMDNEDEWKAKEEQLRRSVVAELEGVHPGPEFWAAGDGLLCI